MGKGRFLAKSLALYADATQVAQRGRGPHGVRSEPGHQYRRRKVINARPQEPSLENLKGAENKFVEEASEFVLLY